MVPVEAVEATGEVRATGTGLQEGEQVSAAACVVEGGRRVKSDEVKSTTSTTL